MTDELKPCPFGSKGKTEIEGKGQIWRGVKGYSDPQYFQLCHHGRLHDSDTFPTVFVEIRARTEEQAREMWNTRADLATPMRCAECDCEKGGADCNWIATSTPLDDPRVLALVEAVKRERDNFGLTDYLAEALSALEENK